MTQLNELIQNCKVNKTKLLELFKAYDLAKLGQEVQDAEIEDIYNAVLNENEFYTKSDYNYRGWPNEPKPGERVTSNDWTFLMSDDENKRLWILVSPRLVEAGLTKENGEYTVQWLTIKMTAHRELREFIITHIIPESMRASLWNSRFNIVAMDKLIDATREAVMGK